MSKAGGMSVITSLCFFMVVLFTACTDNTTPANRVPSKNAQVKPRWADPGNGKIFRGASYGGLPLTAIDAHVFGPVHTVVYCSYKISETDGTKILDDSGHTMYDKFGHMTEQARCRSDGSPECTCVYKYDVENKPHTFDIWPDDSLGSLKVIFKYNTQGQKAEEVHTDAPKKSYSRNVYGYDGKGNLVNDTFYTDHGKYAATATYKYDSRGFQVEYAVKDEHRILLSREQRAYDDNGNKISGATYGADNSLLRKWTAVYDNKGRKSEVDNYLADSVDSKMRYRYDDWDNVIETIACKPDGSIDASRTGYATDFEYDSNGNITKETDYRFTSGKKEEMRYVETKYTYY